MTNHPASAGRYLHLDPADNTVTALADLPAGEPVAVGGLPGSAVAGHRAGVAAGESKRAVSFNLPGPVSYAHKFAAVFIPKGADIVKYGEVIGEATADIRPGEHVHVHNVVGKRARGG
jgi:altronate dehydratase small subunit